MITVGMNYDIREGKDRAFEKKFALVLGAMRAMPGHLCTQLYRAVFKEHSYLVVSEWDTRLAFDSFVQSEQFRKVTSWGNEHILMSQPKHEIYGE